MVERPAPLVRVEEFAWCHAASPNPSQSQIQYGVRPLPTDINQKRSDPILMLSNFRT